MSTKQEQRRELWRQRIAEQETGGQSIRAYCRERELKESAFYGWRVRLRKRNTPVRFALVETKPVLNYLRPVLAPAYRIVVKVAAKVSTSKVASPNVGRLIVGDHLLFGQVLYTESPGRS